MESDSIKLLKECTSGCLMANDSIKQVMPYLENDDLKNILDRYKAKHDELGDEAHRMLIALDSSQKEPSAAATAYSWISTELKMLMNQNTQEIAKIMMKGCGMGIQSVSKFVNEYTAADKDSKEIANKLIKIEEDFMHKLEAFV